MFSQPDCGAKTFVLVAQMQSKVTKVKKVLFLFKKNMHTGFMCRYEFFVKEEI